MLKLSKFAFIKARSVHALLFGIVLFPALSQAAVEGYCERDGKRLTFTDGIAFADAIDADGALTTIVYLTAKTLDRKALAQCAKCNDALPEDTFLSPRGRAVEAQKAAVNEGLIKVIRDGTSDGAAYTVINNTYLRKDGTLTGLGGGNEKLSSAR